jgi:hypothetical protein
VNISNLINMGHLEKSHPYNMIPYNMIEYEHEYVIDLGLTRSQCTSAFLSMIEVFHHFGRTSSLHPKGR